MEWISNAQPWQSCAHQRLGSKLGSACPQGWDLNLLLIDEAGDLAHAMQIPVTTANQWISQAPVSSLLVQAKANNKRVSKTSRKTTEISEPLLTTQHGRETPMPSLGLSRAFRGRLPCLSGDLFSSNQSTSLERARRAGEGKQNESAELMTGRAGATNKPQNSLL